MTSMLGYLPTHDAARPAPALGVVKIGHRVGARRMPRSH